MASGVRILVSGGPESIMKGSPRLRLPFCQTLLLQEEIGNFMAEGVIQKRDYLDTKLTAPVSARIADWYRTSLDGKQLVTYTQRTFAADIAHHPDVLALFTDSGLADLARGMVGDFHPVTAAQIQIRIPESDGGHAQPQKPMHVDGVGCPHLDLNELRTFSLLVGIALSDIADLASGPLRYVPGGHLRMAEWFRDDWKLGQPGEVPPDVRDSPGVPFLGKAGDVVLMHHLVPHAVGRNYTMHPRVMVYFRVINRNHPSRRLAALRNPWLDFPALIATRGQ